MSVIKQNKLKILLGVLIIILFLFIGIGTRMFFSLLKQNQNNNATIQALNSNLKISYNKQGQQLAEKEVILSNYKTLKNLHLSDSSEIGRLKKIINKNTQSASIINSTTSGTLSGKPTIVFVTDPVTDINLPCADTIYPTYVDTLKNKWAIVVVNAGKDSVNVNYIIFNEYVFTQQNKKVGTWPFRKTTTTVSVLNKNPHTSTTGITSYSVAPTNNKGKKITLVAGTALITFITTLFLFK